jgi:hypothetical protein
MRFLLLFPVICISLSAHSQNDTSKTLSSELVENIKDSLLPDFLASRIRADNRVSSVEEKDVIDSIYTFQYSGADRSTPTAIKMSKHYFDEYGKDSLVYHFGKDSKGWKSTQKVSTVIAPDDSHTMRRSVYSWNASEDTWILESENFDFRADGVNQDSSKSIQYMQDGSINYGFKSITYYNGEGLPDYKIDQQIGSNGVMWEDVNKSYFNYDDYGLLINGRRLKWDKISGEWINDTYWEKRYDSIGFEILTFTYNWDLVLEQWKKSSLETHEVLAGQDTQRIQFNYSWEEKNNKWVPEMRDIEVFNEFEEPTLKQIDYWSTISESWLPYYRLEYFYSDQTGEKSKEVFSLTYHKEFSYMDASYESETIFEYDESGNLIKEIRHSRYDKSAEFELELEVFYKYRGKKIISSAPGKLEKPYGQDTICVNSEDVIYKSRWDEGIKSFDWKIIPAEAGTKIPTDSMIYLSLTKEYTGPLGISVSGINKLGAGEYSDTFKITIITPPNPPSMPEGPEEINQFSQEIYYEIVSVNSPYKYYWFLSPESVGELISDNENVQFVPKEGFEGTVEVSVSAENECGRSIPSEPRKVKVQIISAAMDDKLSESFRVYPNPTSGRVSISSGNKYKWDSISIYGFYGHLRNHKIDIIKPNESEIELNLNPGIYLLFIEGGGKYHYEKLIVL